MLHDFHTGDRNRSIDFAHVILNSIAELQDPVSLSLSLFLAKFENSNGGLPACPETKADPVESVPEADPEGFTSIFCWIVDQTQ